MDWLRDGLRLRWLPGVCAWTSAVCALFLAPEGRASSTQASVAEVWDFQSFWQRVRAASFALQRADENIKSAEASAMAVREQSAAALQWSSSLTAQWVNPSRHQHALTVGATLWDFGRQSAQELRAYAQRLSSEAQRAEAEENLRIRAARMYVAAAGAEAILAAAQEQLRNAESKLKAVTSGYHRGERPQSDVIKARADFGKARIFFSKSSDEAEWLRQQMLLATQQVSSPTAAPLHAHVRLRPLLVRSPNDWTSFLAGLNGRPVESAVLERLRAGKMSLESELDALRAEQFPTLTASAGAQTGGSFLPLKADLLGQLNLQYTLPLGDVREQRRLAVLARLRENALSKSEELKARDDKLRQSNQRMTDLLGQMNLQKSQIDLLLEYQKLVRNRYFSGRASLLELTTTEDELLSNRLELLRMELNLYVFAIDALEALGGKTLETLF